MLKIRPKSSSVVRAVLLLTVSVFALVSTPARAEDVTEDFEDGALPASISVSTVGTFSANPGIKEVAVFGSARAFGFGRSTCGANCFNGYVTSLKITFPNPTYVSTLAFKDMEMYGNWGSGGKIYVDGAPLTAAGNPPPFASGFSWETMDFGRSPGNDLQADTAYRTHAFAINRVVSLIELRVGDITSQSEIFIDDLVVLGSPPTGPVRFAENGHYYEFVQVTNPYGGANTWAAANAAAASKTHNGLAGHLATITSQAENDFLLSLAAGYNVSGAAGAWLGGRASQGWLAGPERGQPFGYTYWNDASVGGGDPNNAGYVYMMIGAEGDYNFSHWVPGRWLDDDSGDQGSPDPQGDPVIGYFIEYEPAAGPLWSDDFESYPPGGFPSATWTNSGNTAVAVEAGTGVGGSQSLKAYGIVGGCWGALAHRPLAVPIQSGFVVEMDVRTGAEELSGCHSTYADVQLLTGPSWTFPARLLASFDVDDSTRARTIRGHWTSTPTEGPNLGTFTTGTWYKVKVQYERVDAATVRLTYWINDVAQGSYTVPAFAYENDLAYLSIGTGEGTAWFDNVQISPLSTPPTLTALAVSPPGPQPVGTALTFTATATGGTAPLQCKWFVTGDPTWATFYVLRHWQSCATAVDWTPPGVGTYYVAAWARSSGSVVDAPAGPAANRGVSVTATGTGTTVPVIIPGPFPGSQNIDILDLVAAPGLLFGSTPACFVRATIRNKRSSMINVILTFNAFDHGGNGVGIAAIQELQPANSTEVKQGFVFNPSTSALPLCSALGSIVLDTSKSLIY